MAGGQEPAARVGTAAGASRCGTGTPVLPSATVCGPRAPRAPGERRRRRSAPAPSPLRPPEIAVGGAGGINGGIPRPLGLAACRSLVALCARGHVLRPAGRALVCALPLSPPGTAPRGGTAPGVQVGWGRVRLSGPSVSVCLGSRCLKRCVCWRGMLQCAEGRRHRVGGGRRPHPAAVPVFVCACAAPCRPAKSPSSGYKSGRGGEIPFA